MVEIAEYQRAGRTSEAQALLAKAFRLGPDHPDVLHLAGVMAHEGARQVEALEYLDRALARHPRLAAAHASRGDVLRALGRPDEALSAYRASLALWPGSALAWCHLGHALRELSRPDESLRAYREAIARAPDQAEAHLSLGQVHESLGEERAALAAYEAAARVQPESAVVLERLGVALRRAGRVAEGAEACRRAVALDPGSPSACCQLGVALLELGQFAEAADVLQAALTLDPDNPEAHNAMGRVRQELGYLDQALSAYRQALAIHPDYAEAHLNLGILLDMLGSPVGALASFRACLTFAPECAAAHGRMGGVLATLGQANEAVACYRRALELEPGPAETWAAYGDALRLAGQPADAVAAYDESLTRRPGNPRVVWHRGLAQLALGNYREGWRGFEARWEVPELGRVQRRFDAPRWQGASLAGRTILVHAEAGPGETLQFCRYLPALAERGARVILECQPGLRRLLEAMPCVAQAIVAGEPLPPFDCHVPLGSVPGLLGRGVGSMIESLPYLPTRIWSSRVPLLPPGPGLRIGLALSERGEVPSFPARQLSELLRLPGISWYQLSRLDLSPGGQEGVPAIPDLTSNMEELADAAPLVSQLDLVIAIDGTVAHLAGGIGANLWVVTGPSRPWPWYDEGERSDWYPLARVFSQAQPGEWGGVLDDLRRALRQLPEA